MTDRASLKPCTPCGFYFWGVGVVLKCGCYWVVLVGSMISVSGLVSWVKWSLELNGLKLLLVSVLLVAGPFGLWY